MKKLYAPGSGRGINVKVRDSEPRTSPKPILNCCFLIAKCLDYSARRTPCTVIGVQVASLDDETGEDVLVDVLSCFMVET